MIEIRYTALHLLVVLALFLFCNKMSKSPQSYWKYAFIPICLFSLEEGLRWGREIDWCVYYGVYDDLKHNIFEGHEPLFTAIWWSFAHLGFDYPVVITFCSFLLVFSIFYFFKPYNKINKIAIPFAILMSAGAATNLIRWYMGVSFLIIGLRFYLDGNKFKSYLFSIMACCTHIGIVFIVPLLYYLLNIKKEIMKAQTAIIISILLSLLFDRSIFGYFSFLFDMLNFYSRFAQYSESSEEWLIGLASNNGSDRESFGQLLFISVPMLFFIYYGYKAIKEKDTLIPYWNTMVIGIFFRNIARGLELIGRYTLIFDILICISASYATIYLFKKRYKNLIDIFAIIVLSAFFLKKIYVFTCSVYEDTELMQYVWDMRTSPNTLIYDFYLKDK